VNFIHAKKKFLRKLTNPFEYERRRVLGPRLGRRPKMGMRQCCQGHEIRLPWYGPMPFCNDCRDLIMDYAGISDEDKE
jgi:hypothetical protein